MTLLVNSCPLSRNELEDEDRADHEADEEKPDTEPVDLPD